MIELLSHPVVIPGKVPSISNISVNFRMLKVPLERIKNARTRNARMAYDQASAWKEAASWQLRAAARSRAPAGTAVFVFARLAFKSALGMTEPTRILNDVDNPSKALLDALQRSSVIANDRQVLLLVLDKVCGGAEPGTHVISVCAARPDEKAAWLARLPFEGP